jgi:type I restriction enzyme S subunit
MYRVLQSEAFKVFCDLSSLGSTIQHLYQNVFEDFAFPVPSLQEQRSIAAFLDRETAKIDSLITEQKKLIALLAEKRQATIAKAVTCGLNLDVQMKDTEVEWLGNMPAHWKITTISKATTKITNGYVGPTRDILVDDGIPYVQATHIKEGRVNFGNDYFVDATWSQRHAKSILREDDVLIVQTGAGTGDVGLVSKNESGFNCHALIILSTDKSKLFGAYLAAVLQSSYGRAKLASIQTGAMHPHLNCGEVKFVEVPMPPLSEQRDIINFLNIEIRKLDSLEAEVAHDIALLNERRSALITEAVTGQIDVRGVAPQTAVANREAMAA